MDKGYTEMADTLRAIIPKNKPVNGWLTSDKRSLNSKISSDLVIVENYLRRLCPFNLNGAKSVGMSTYTMNLRTRIYDVISFRSAENR